MKLWPKPCSTIKFWPDVRLKCWLKFISRNACIVLAWFWVVIHQNGDGFLSHLVTADKIWVSYSNVKINSTDNAMVPLRFSKPKMFMQTHRRKQMATVFCDQKRILLVDYLEPAETITSERYCQMLRTLRQAIQNKRRGTLSSGIGFIHDNDRPRTAHRTGNSNGISLFHLNTSRTAMSSNQHLWVGFLLRRLTFTSLKSKSCFQDTQRVLNETMII